jgi:cell division protein FtsB
MKKVRYDTKNRRSRTTEKENFLNRVLDSRLGKIILLAVSILMILSVYRSFKQMGQKISLLKQAEQEVRELRLENLELSLEIEEAGGVDTLEREARDRLNYGKDGELVFVIDDELIEVGKERVQAILNPKQELEDIDILGEWLDFMVMGY